LCSSKSHGGAGGIRPPAGRNLAIGSVFCLSKFAQFFEAHNVHGPRIGDNDMRSISGDKVFRRRGL
jgi:hypothetical protein